MSDPHTVVFRNGAVFCADEAGSWASAVAVRGDRIVAVGGEAEVGKHAALADEVVDLDGRLLVPGFVDAHAHPIQGGLERIRCDLSEGHTAADFTGRIGEYAAAHPERAWILGGGWSMAAFPQGTPTRAALDAVVAERPVYLPNRDHHSAWVNSRALELAGVSARTPDPADGRIERDADGAPTGVLHEGAMSLVERLLPADSEQDLLDGLRAGQAYLHSLGVVAWQDAIVHHEPGRATEHSAYLRADREGWLSARVAGALWWDRSVGPDDVEENLARLREVREEARRAGGRYTAGNVKIMQDGVVETHTAALLEPYLTSCGCPGHNQGLSFVEPQLLRRIVAGLDAAEFDVHFHALGDRAVREVLDAIEHARERNGSSGRRHHLAHLQVVHPDDVPRFRRLGATANLQALWACHEPQMDELSIPFLGAERSGWQYPFGDLFRSGATLAMGSDWPVSTPDPLQALHVAVNRCSPDAPDDTPALGPEQALPLATALRAYTAGSAWVNRLEGRNGTLAAGRPADLVVLDRDPFDLPTSRIGETTVHRTYVAGQLVHRAD